MNQRVAWDALPACLRDRIQSATGPVNGTGQVSTGHNCLVALIVHTAGGDFFLKGVPASQASAVRSQSVEAAINPVVASASAA